MGISRTLVASYHNCGDRETSALTGEEVKAKLQAAAAKLVAADAHLLEHDLSERCIAARLAMYLQEEFPDLSVDVEYNRIGANPKTMAIPEECANYRSNRGEPLVVPDVIVHKRGADGPNLLVLELKKTTNHDARACDHMRIRAFRKQLNYGYAALVECETRGGRAPEVRIAEWLA
jgi:hypothetical protein